MKTVTIGDTPLMGITGEHLKQIVMIEGCCAGLEFWNEPIITELDNTMFSNNVVIDFYSIRKSDNLHSSPITFFFHTDDLRYHYVRDLRMDEALRREAPSRRLGIKSISFLINNGYNVPL